MVTGAEGLGVAAAGFVAGAVNTVAGGGSLITFPTLVAFGVPPLTANVSNTVGLIPGAVGGTVGYREELRDQGARLRRLAAWSLLGAALGAAALLAAPSAFEAIVPFLVAASCLLLLVQPRLSRLVARGAVERSPALAGGMVVAGAYGAYFGSAVGILTLALLTVFVPDDVQRLNALKGVLAGLMNLLAAVVYAFLAPVRWPIVLILAIASLAGGRIGARVARRIPGPALRVGIALVGLVVAVRLAV